MNRPRSRRHAPLLLAVALGAQLAVAAPAPEPAGMASGAAISQSLRPYFPNVPLLTQEGKQVRFYDDLIRGKVVLIQLLSTDCSKYCSTITPNLVKVQQELRRQLGDQAVMLSLTVNPDLDSPRVLRRYASRYHVDRGWYFLTGRKADVDLIRRRLGVYDPDEERTAHVAVLTVGNEPEGQWLAMPALSAPSEIVRTTRRIMGQRSVPAR